MEMAVEEAAYPRSLRKAMLTAIALVGLVVLFYFLGRSYFFGLVCAVVLISLFELLDALATGRNPTVIFGLLCALAMLLVAYFRHPSYFAVVLAIALFGSFLLALRPNRGPTPASDVAWTFLGVGWIGGGGAGAVTILMLNGAGGGARLLIAFILIAALDDIGAYFCGTRFGRHRMAPSISPGKSWEGFGGGLLASTAGGYLLGSLFAGLSPVHGIGIGVVCGLLAPVGDLLESLVKREIGIKDSGRILPGHGGFLDRLDGTIFCAPAIALYLIFVAF
jgi:phosphatidate cytidylyltransferase